MANRPVDWSTKGTMKRFIKYMVEDVPIPRFLNWLLNTLCVVTLVEFALELLTRS